MSKIEGVIRVHPNGVQSKALVFVKDKKVDYADKFRDALKNTKDLRFRKMEPAKP